METVEQAQQTVKQNKTRRLILGVLIFLCAVVLAAAVVFYVMHQNGFVLGTHVENGDGPLNVEFAPLTTTAEEYESLRAVCGEYILSHGGVAAEGSADPIVEVSEDTFVDHGEEPNAAEPEAAVEYVEYDAAYFQDLMLTRYVSQNGELQVIAARIDRKNKGAISLLTQEELSSDLFALTGWEAWSSNLLPVEELTESGAVSEKVYMACIEQCVLKLLAGLSDHDALISHFTETGRSAVVRAGAILGIDQDCGLQVSLCLAGKSHLGKEVPDRVYLRCQVTRGEAVEYVNLLLKVNGDLKIFDVDML